MSSSSSRSRRRKVAEEEVEAPQPPEANGKEEIGKVAAAVKVNPKKLYSFNPTYAEFPEKLVVVPKATKKDINLWEKLAEDAQDVCVRRILRLFLTKGAKRELIKYVVCLPILNSMHCYLLSHFDLHHDPNALPSLHTTLSMTYRKDTITKVLKDIDPTYGAVANSVLKVVKEELKENFGYSLTCRADPTIAKESNEFVLFNALHGPHLQDLLADGSSVQKSAWLGFVFVVLQCVNSSAGKTIDFQTLLTRIREIDDRFPDTALKKAATNSSGAVPVPELGADFPSLMKRMVNERYVTVVAETGSAIKETKEENKTRYVFCSIDLPSFSVCDVSVSLLSIYCILWHHTTRV
jgi:hypothetical protein